MTPSTAPTFPPDLLRRLNALDATPPPALTNRVAIPRAGPPSDAGPPATAHLPPGRERSAADDGPGGADVFPQLGAKFLGFRLVGELGRGAFGRVYLAEQGELAGRPVALKVATGIAAESQTLAQLQHTNIVPIYSFHRVGLLQAVCMPFFGRTTLADVVQQISGRPSLPLSGRELRSTVNPGKANTLSPRDPARPPAGASSPTAPAGEPPDGWARLDGLS